MAKHKGQKLFQCPVCHKEYISKGQFDLHMKTHIKNGELNYECSQCGKSYPYEDLTELGSEGPHQCIECDKGILKVQHISSYKKVNVFRCPHCYERFLKVVDLTKHVVEVHPESECHPCPECDKTFPLKLKLAVHMQVHRKEKQDCPLCGMVLGSKRALKGHLRMHQGERKYKCSLCDKTYLHLQSLKNHVVTHNGMKQFKCALCDKAFSHESTLRHHEKKHTAVRPRRRIQKPKPSLFQETREVSEEQDTFPGKDLQERQEHHVHEPGESNPILKVCQVRMTAPHRSQRICRVFSKKLPLCLCAKEMNRTVVG
ncbi:zinc finger protein 782-like [Strongylocentrotus purpuratus]|uniref:C2H2-type domain-containing protein n=1 Tax=Strongylocentrotus purpuratus TaxID=7668 RepID=A0A7M7PBF3_STRPU|nr:zinc finger protein 782-like [Strongylocentrotus purpuratus]